jgi:hypothetical protein
MPTLVLAGLLLAHALIHASYLSPRPPATAGGPTWPFELDRSRLLRGLGLQGHVPRPLGIGLIALTLAGFGLAALATLGLGPASMFGAGIITGAIASMALLALCFHPWLSLGIAIDLVLLWAVVVARWTPIGAVV